MSSIRAVQDRLEADAKTRPQGSQREALLTQLSELTEQLDQLQVQQPLAYLCVDEQTVGAVVSDWTGIPLGKMLRDEMATVLRLDASLAERVIGQDHALQAISRVSYTHLTLPTKA